MLELKYLHHASVLQCAHGGKVEFIPPPRRSFHIEDSPILTEMDLLKATIVGCPQAGPGVKPCTKITKILMGKAREIRVDGEVPLLENLRAATDGTPPGICSKVINNLSNAKTGSVQLDGAQAQTLITAREAGMPFCEICEQEKAERHWIEIELVDEEGQPVAGEEYYVIDPDGNPRRGLLDGNGFAREDDFENAGVCKITFPNLDKDAWVSD